MKDTIKRILTISYNKKLSHLSSCLTAESILEEIFDKMADGDVFVLSCGHAGLALYVTLEARGGRDAEEIFDHHGVHPDKCDECGLDCSSGSLGHGIGIAVGRALASPDKQVYCLISDGECDEGSVWEALRIKRDRNVPNLQIYANLNGTSAYKEVYSLELQNRLLHFGVDCRITDLKSYPYLKGFDSHYYILTDSDYETYIR